MKSKTATPQIRTIRPGVEIAKMLPSLVQLFPVPFLLEEIEYVDASFQRVVFCALKNGKRFIS